MEEALPKLGTGLEQLGFEGTVHVNPHKFRHTYATLAVTKFDPPWTVGEAATWPGHTVQVFERTYRHAIPHFP